MSSKRTFDQRLDAARQTIQRKYGSYTPAPLVLEGTDHAAEVARLQHYDDPFHFQGDRHEQ